MASASILCAVPVKHSHTCAYHDDTTLKFERCTYFRITMHPVNSILTMGPMMGYAIQKNTVSYQNEYSQKGASNRTLNKHHRDGERCTYASECDHWHFRVAGL